MKYDFVTVPDRFNTMAEKYVQMRKLLPGVKDNIVPFSVADMDFVLPSDLKQGMMSYIDDRILGYTLPKEAYYEGILNWIKKRHGLELDREWLVDADNVIDALKQMIFSYTEPEDEIVVMTPAYPPFLFSVPMAHRRLIESPLYNEAQSYQINYELLEEQCKRETTKLLLFCNPHNPVGRCWTKEELIKVADICLTNNVFIISDEIHWDLIMPGHTFTSMASLEEKYARNCAVSTSATKTFNLAALKGAVIILRDEMRRTVYLDYVQAHGVSGRDILSYVGCEVAYRTCEEWLDELLFVLDRNRELLKDFFTNNIPEAVVYPLEATYLQWIDFRFLNMTSKEQEAFMQQKANCFFTEGYKFGSSGAGFERWNIACPEKVLLEGLERMKNAIDEWRSQK